MPLYDSRRGARAHMAAGQVSERQGAACVGQKHDPMQEVGLLSSTAK